MKLSVRWLRELVDLEGVSAAAVAETLTFHTAEVEGIQVVGGQLDQVLTARVLTCAPHPNADRLRVTTVDRGDGVVRTVVCGASNVAAGQVVCHAPVGATLPSGVTLALRPIRGVPSDGMICAEDELGLGKEHDGILVLDPATPTGRPVGEALGLRDEVLEVGNTAITHRPDLWGHVGFARELGAVLGRKTAFPSAPRAQAAVAAAAGPAVAVRAGDPRDCRRYVGLAVAGLVNGPSPATVRRRLEALGVRSVDLLVDLTQLVMLEQGQPLHAFDLAALAAPVEVRRARPGERLTTLDGQERRLEPDDLVIADARRVLALAGILGGADGGVRAGTSAVLLESACFDPVRIRRTSARLGLRTDASARFEKSLDPHGALPAALRFLELVLAHLPGARVSARAADEFPAPGAPLDVDLPYERVRRRLGMRVADSEVRVRLQALGFGVTEGRDGVRVRVPSWRATRDVSVAEDLVEEVGRTRGYADVVPVAPVAPLRPVRLSPLRVAERRAAAVLSLELGAVQTTCYSFYAREDAERIGLGDVRHLTLANPLAADQDRLVQSTLPNLLKAAARNLPREAVGRLWESARLLPAAAAGSAQGEVPVLGLLTWDRDASEDPAGRLFLAAVQDLRTLLRRLGAADVQVQEGVAALAAGLAAPRALHPGRCATLSCGGAVAAVVGEVGPQARRAYGLAGRQTHAEVSLAALAHLGGAAAAGEYAPVPRFPVAPFDVSVVVPRRVPAARVGAVIREAAPGEVQGVRVIDVYEGAGIPAGQRSLTFTCDLLDPQATLTPQKAEAARSRIQRALEVAGWTVRAAPMR